MAADHAGAACHCLRCRHVLVATQSSHRCQVSYTRGKGLDHGGGGTRRRREVKETPNLCHANPGRRKSMASGSNRFHHGKRFVFPELLDAATRKVFLPSLLEDRKST